jgi:hypothetical protein
MTTRSARPRATRHWVTRHWVTRHWTGRLAAVTLVLIAGGCGRGVRSGSALAPEVYTSIGAKAIRPGFEIGLLYYDFENTSSSALTIDSVGISGPGIGTVVRPVQIKIAPLRYGYHHYEPHSVAAALYTTDPPVLMEKNCRVQALFPVRRFRMAPGTDVRVWVVLRARRPGHWAIPRHVIYYTQDGSSYRQAEPLRAYGLVTAKAAYIPPDYGEAACVRPERARFLSGYHPGRVSY